MNVQQDISIKSFNTFGIDVKATEFIEIFSVEELKEVLKTRPLVLPLGGGSNVLLTKDVEIPILKISIKGIEIVHQDDDFVWVKAGAGENWHEFVEFCIRNNYGGIENLSLIPGSVGASPIQNIGAYGVEIKDVMESCEALHRHEIRLQTFTNAQCNFGYRTSVFKTTQKGNYIITSVTFKLTKRAHHLRIDYGDIRKYLSGIHSDRITSQDVSNAVIAIRSSKLPNPKVLGNSGSFFKNPVVSAIFFSELKNKYPQIPHYFVSEKEVKIPAGWLIESLGLKGYRQADAGVHTQQSLVLVNYGNASGQDIYNLATYIQQKVLEAYHISLEMEVNVV